MEKMTKKKKKGKKKGKKTETEITYCVTVCRGELLIQFLRHWKVNITKGLISADQMPGNHRK